MPAGHAHTPLVHVCPPEQTAHVDPHLRGFVCVSAKQPSTVPALVGQYFSPAAQPHVIPAQTSKLLQLEVQPPQWSLSFERSKQPWIPGHVCSPTGHMHCPLEQSCSDGHATQAPPQ